MGTNILKKWGVEWHRQQGESGLEWAVEEETADFLYGFVRMVKPIKCLEIGTFEGTSAIAIGKALQKNKIGNLWTIDVKDFGQAKRIKEHGLENIVFCLIEPAENALRLKNNGLFDFIFIDDGHSYEEVMRDLNISHSLIKQFGCILGHDVINTPSVNMALEDFLNYNKNKYEKIILASYCGMFILKRIYV